MRDAIVYCLAVIALAIVWGAAIWMVLQSIGG
jgi:hypothetical protein